MSSKVIAALDEVRGRCVGLKVNFPDTCAGVDPAIDKIQVFIRKATKGVFTLEHEQDLADTLYGVKTYCDWLIKEYPETRGDCIPLMKTIDYLIMVESVH